ncbi:copper amine oxidase N-terminal domain-containing protein [Tyzzerella sp. OttesenSCG-928-J15]|nr:copper amine oxidase N-terminal domain-containing protein [Tyzzerella sp. OttesenSCG-928-J15]
MKLNDKILSSFLVAALLTVVILSKPNLAFAANPVEVYKDGIELEYTDAQPQIINDRTMVPLAETATHFGMTYVWNAETATMVFSGNGRTMIHTVYDNKIYVNGTAVEFDYTSVIVNSRTLMPIRMLAEAIGCVVEWDATGIVDIWSDASNATGSVSQPTNNNQNQQNSNDSNNQNSNQTAVVSIYSVTQSKQNIEMDQSLRISVDTNKAADCVKVTDFDGNILEEETEYEEDSQGRYFMVEVYPTEVGESTLKIYAGNDGVYSPASKSISINVIENKKNIIIEDIRLSSKNIYTRDYVDMTLITTKNVKKLEVIDDGGHVIKTVKNRAGSNADYYEWEFWFSADDKTGDFTYSIKAYDDDGNSEKENFTFTVKSKDGSSSSNSTSPEIIKADADDNVNFANENCWFEVKTNLKVERIEVRDDRDNLKGSSTRYTTDGSYRIWEFSAGLDYSGSYRVYAYDNSSNYDYETINIKGY